MQSALISPLSIAPMIDWTDTHFRMLMRILAPNALLYTEMQVVETVIHNPNRALFFNPKEFPIALQLGGSDPKKLAFSAKRGEESGFQEININLGCPSNKVRSGGFGACLMLEPERVTDCITAMKQAVKIPVTAKIRIGIDHQDDYEFLYKFANRLVQAGCDKLIVHARKAWLTGLSPKQNRTIPPVCYPYVYRLKQELSSDIPIVINGNINTWDEIYTEHMPCVDGVMIGRLACNNPYAIAVLHHQFFPDIPLPDRNVVAMQYFDYASNYIKEKIDPRVSLNRLLKPIMNLSYGLSNAKEWKKSIMEMIQRKSLSLDLVDLMD